MKDLFGLDRVHVVSLRSPMAVQLANDTEGITMMLVADDVSVNGELATFKVLRCLAETGSTDTHGRPVPPRERDCNPDAPVMVPLSNIAGWTTVKRET